MGLRGAWLSLLLAAAGCGRVGFGEPSEEGLVAHFTLDSLNGNGADDTLGGVRATCNPECPSVTAGRVGNAMSFDGNRQRLEVASSSAVTTPQAFTVSVWTMATGTSVNLVCIATKKMGPDVRNSWAICLEGGVVVFPTSENGMIVELSSSGTLSPGVWHHIAATWDGNVKALYIDGVLDRTMPSASDDFDSGVISIGSDHDNALPNLFYPGAIDELRIYDRALAADEVAAAGGS